MSQSGGGAGRCYSCCCYRVSEWALLLPQPATCPKATTASGGPARVKATPAQVSQSISITPHGHLPPLHHLPHPHPPPAQVPFLKDKTSPLVAASLRWATLAPSCSCRRRRSTRSPPRLASPSSRSELASTNFSVGASSLVANSSLPLCCEAKWKDHHVLLFGRSGLLCLEYKQARGKCTYIVRPLTRTLSTQEWNVTKP